MTNEQYRTLKVGDLVRSSTGKKYRVSWVGETKRTFVQTRKNSKGKPFGPVMWFEPHQVEVDS